MSEEYQLLDSGDGEKLEQVGPYMLIRPAPQATWKKTLDSTVWYKANAHYKRLTNSGKWETHSNIPNEWTISYKGLSFEISLSPSGSIGIYPEHYCTWDWLSENVQNTGEDCNVLNLFAYTGATTMALAKSGSNVCHVDANRGAVNRAKKNARSSGLESANIRWITDDVTEFVKREGRRDRKYNGIVLDPPSFGRSKKSATFDIHEDLEPLLQQCVQLLDSSNPFLLLTCHTSGITKSNLKKILSSSLTGSQGLIKSGTLTLSNGEGKNKLISGVYAAWKGK